MVVHWEGRFRIMSLGIFALFSMAGCGVANMKYSVNEPNKAFFDAYKKHVVSKYDDAAGGSADVSRLREYDKLAAVDDKIEQAKALDEKQILKLEADMDRLRDKSNSAKAEAAPLAERTKEKRRQIDKLDTKRKLLGNAEKDEQKIADIEALLTTANVELAVRINDDAIRQEQLSAVQTQITTINEQIVALRRRNYPAFADQERQRIRNEIIHEILLNADTAYLVLRSNLLMGRASGDTLLDIGELTMSTATALSGGAMAKANLGAAAALVKGSRGAVDKNFFAQQALASIINAIDDRRQIDKTNIIKGLGRTTADYTLQQALADARLYESRASMMSGVLDLANQTANNVKNSEKDLEKEKKNQEAKPPQ